VLLGYSLGYSTGPVQYRPSSSQGGGKGRQFFVRAQASKLELSTTARLFSLFSAGPFRTAVGSAGLTSDVSVAAVLLAAGT
jgi:hypothetical protein